MDIRRTLPAAVIVLAWAAEVTATPPTVKGMDGQPDLRLDHGRRLSSYPLTKRDARRAFGAAKPGRSSRHWLGPLEKTRLDARRIGAAKRLSLAEKLHRLVSIVEKRMPVENLPRYDASSSNQVRRGGATLSRYVRERTGTCRERAFLLRGLLRETPIRSRVVYCEVYDAKDTYLGDHAYVEVATRGRRVLLDPFNPTPVQPLRHVTVQSESATGRTTVKAAVTDRGFLYLPTHDLRITRQD